MRLRNCVPIISALLVLAAPVSRCEFYSFSDHERELGALIQSPKNIFSDEEIFALSTENRVILRKVVGLRQLGDADEFYGLYIPSSNAIELKRATFSRFLSKHDTGAQMLGVFKVNGLLEIHHGNKRLLIKLMIPNEPDRPGRVAGSWSFSPGLAKALREAWAASAG